MVHKLTAPWYLTLRNRHFARVRLFNKKITTFDIGTEQMLEFQNPFERTVFFCVNCVVFTFRWGKQPSRSQSVAPLSEWHACKLSMRTQTQPSSMHQSDVKNTSRHQHGYAPQTVVVKLLVHAEKRVDTHCLSLFSAMERKWGKRYPPN